MKRAKRTAEMRFAVARLGDDGRWALVQTGIVVESCGAACDQDDAMTEEAHAEICRAAERMAGETVRPESIDVAGYRVLRIGGA